MDAFDQYQIFECLSSVNKTKMSCWNEKDVLHFLHLTNLNLYEKSFANLHVNGQKLIDSFTTYKYEKFIEKTGVQSVLHYQKLLILVYALKDNYDLYLEIKIKYESLHEKNKEKVQKCLYQYLLVERAGVSEKMLQLLEESKGIKKENIVYNPSGSSSHNFRKNATRRICVTQAQKGRVNQIIRDMSFPVESSRECIILYTPQHIAYVLQQFSFSTLISISNIWGIDGFMLMHLFPIYSPKQLELALDCKNSEIATLFWVSDALTALKYQIIWSFTENVPSPIQQKSKNELQKQEESHSQMLFHPLEKVAAVTANIKIEDNPNKSQSVVMSPSLCNSNSNHNNNIPQLNFLLPPSKPVKKQSEDTSETTSASNTPARNYPTKISMKISEDNIVSPAELSDSIFMFMPEIMREKQQNSQEQRKHRISITFKNEQRKISAETDSAANSCMLDSSTECPTKSSQKEPQKWSSQVAEESFGESQILIPPENTEQPAQSNLAAQIENRQAFCESITFDQTIKPDNLFIPTKEPKQLSAIMELNKSADSLSQQDSIQLNTQPIESTSRVDLQFQQNLQNAQSQSSFQESVLLGDFQPPQIQLQNQSSSQTDPSSSSLLQQAQVTYFQQDLRCKSQKQPQNVTRNEFADSVILNDPPTQTLSNITSILTAPISDSSQKQIAEFATSTVLAPPIAQQNKQIPISNGINPQSNLNNSINLQDSEIFTISNKHNVSTATKETVSQDQFSDSVILTNNETQSFSTTSHKSKVNDQIELKNTSHELKNVLQLMGAISEPKYENNINMPRQSVIRNIHGDIDFNQSVVLNNQLLFNNGSSSNSGNSGNSQNEGSENPQDQNIGNLKDARQTFSVGTASSAKGKSDQYFKLMSALSSKTPNLCFNPFDMTPLKKQNLLKIRIKSPDGSLSFDQTVTTEGASIGRKSENSINFPKEQTVSSFHAEIFFSEFAFHLRDKGSKLGTYIKIKDIVLIQEMRLQLSISVEIRIIEVNNEQGAIKMELRRNSGSKQYTSTYSYIMVENQSIKLGRDRERCEIEIKEITISNEHARIIYKNGVFQMIDSDSRNGIWLRMSPKGVVSAPTIITSDFSFRIDLINISVIKLETHPYFHPIK